jgi:hypothetical protein
MDSGWFYIDGANRYGPLTVDVLRAALVTLPDPRRVLVWCEGMPAWSEAGQIAALAQALPPSPPPAPIPSARAGLFAQAGDPGVEAIVEGARRFRTLVLLVGAQILMGVLMPFVIGLAALMPEAVFGFLALGYLVALGALSIWTAVSVYRVADAIDAGAPVLWVLLQFVPFVNIIALLVLSAKAQTWCRHHGVEVGFFGPTETSLARLRGLAN